MIAVVDKPLHRNLKPQYIMVTPEEGLKVTYLGITETSPNKPRIISKSYDIDKVAKKEQHPLEQKGVIRCHQQMPISMAYF
ncbi:hypothetical protein [Laceyella putida]|uniref:Uncharacterized protein n=1 Tax=Laceyella putida TaxID=110101 RepID=A0ABW2RHH7_9BACL